jgi:hypothetical protein
LVLKEEQVVCGGTPDSDSRIGEEPRKQPLTVTAQDPR